jgi:hypothetical protein
MTWKTIVKILLLIALEETGRSVEGADIVLLVVIIFAFTGLLFLRKHLRRVALAILAAALVSAVIHGIIYQRVERTEAEVVGISATSRWSSATTFGAQCATPQAGAGRDHDSGRVCPRAQSSRRGGRVVRG